MKRLQAVMQINIYLMVILASGMLTGAEGFANSFPLQALSIPLALIAYFFVERWEKTTLPTWGANVAGVLAVLVALKEFSGGGEGRLTSGAHFVVMLTWITLFLRKTPREYWWLCALSVLQVAVGAVLTSAGIYGAMLILYMALSVWTLSVAALYRSRQRFDLAESAARRELGSVATQATASRESGVAAAAAALTAPLRQEGAALGSVQRDPAVHWLSTRFVFNNLGTSLLALVFAFLLFLGIPRNQHIWGTGQRQSGDDDSGGASTTGFAREIKLGDIGQIMESSRRVMEVRLVNHDDNQPRDLAEYARQMGYDSPYFRGSVMTSYEDGGWKHGDRYGQTREFGNLQTISSSRGQGMVRQEYRLEPVDKEILFGMLPAQTGTVEDAMMQWDSRTLMLTRPRHLQSRSDPVKYMLLSPPARENLHHNMPMPMRGSGQLFGRIPRSLLRVPEELQTLQTIARREAAWDGVENNPDEVTRVRALIAWLRDSGEFSYTLNASVTDSRIDPLEGFLVNRRSGHCEYFASALTLMLRAVNVPARMVSGFKGAERNTITGYYEVQERYAHAWVEAYVDGQWVTLDPTPANARDEAVKQAGNKGTSWSQFRAAIREFWTRYVVNLNAFQQQNLLTPFKNLAMSVWQLVSDGGKSLANLWQQIVAVVRSPQRWISWQGGLITFVGLTFIAGVVWLIRAAWRLWQRFRVRHTVGLSAKRRTVAFYERFAALCRRYGLERQPAQTQAEFSKHVFRTLSERFPDVPADHFPQQLIALFYRVRFGQQELDEGTLTKIETELNTFDTSLKQVAQAS